MEKCLQHKNYRDISTKRGESFKADVSIPCSLNSEMKVGDNHTEVLKHTDFEDHVTLHPNKTVSLPMSSIRTSSMMANQDHSFVVIEGQSSQLISDTVQMLSLEPVQRDLSFSSTESASLPTYVCDHQVLTVWDVPIIQYSDGDDPCDVDRSQIPYVHQIAQDIDHAVMQFNSKLDATIAKVYVWCIM